MRKTHTGRTYTLLTSKATMSAPKGVLTKLASLIKKA